MRTSSDAMYAKSRDDTAAMDKLDTAIMRNGGFALQEGWSNEIMAVKGGKWSQWRDRNATGGRAARRAGGDTCVITNLAGQETPAWKKSLATALLLAAGNHLAYTRDADRSWLALACRHSELIYGDELRWLTAEAAAAAVKVDAGGREVWWRDWVRLLPAGRGKRLYLVHLVNPPDGDIIKESKEPQPLRDVQVSFTPPAGWKATTAWLLSAERQQSVVSSIVGRTRQNDGREEPYRQRRYSREGQVSCEPLPLAGGAVGVPELKRWGIVLLECDGPAGDAAPSDARPLFAAPKIPDLATPIQAAKAAGAELANFGPAELLEQDKALRTTEDRLSPTGRAAAIGGSFVVKVRKTYGLNWGWVQPIPTGLYRIAVRCRAPRPLTGKVTLTCSTGEGASAQNRFPIFPKFEQTHAWDLAAVPADRYGELSVDMTWQEMPCQAVLKFDGSAAAGLLVDEVTVQCLKVLDSERVKVWKGGWPEGTRLVAHEGTRVWYGRGLYYDYFRLEQALAGLPGLKVDAGVYFKVGQHPCGFKGVDFPPADKLAQYDLLAIADVDALPFRPPQRDTLRGWVRAGGVLVMMGGPYGFGCGEWHLSDLLADLWPAEMAGKYGLQPVGVDKPVALAPASLLAKQVHWAKPPVLMWQHAMKAKPDATVHVTADGKPVVITRPYGKGKVCFIAATPLGDAPAGQTAFWDWPEWPKLLNALVRSMLADGRRP